MEQMPTQEQFDLLRDDKLSICDVKDHLPDFVKIKVEIDKMVDSKMVHFKEYMEEFRV
jgi:hypothetical protein